MKLPNPLGIPFGEGRRVQLFREADGGFTATLILLGPYYSVETTNRVARQSRDGAVSGDSELVAAMPGFVEQRERLLNQLLDTAVMLRWLDENKAAIISASEGAISEQTERAQALAARIREARGAGRLEEARELLEELVRLRDDFKDLFGLHDEGEV
jgi:hypothetical protein